jgi:hypothetical protein
MTRSTVLTVVIGVAVAAPCAAQIALPIHIMPVMAKVSGAADTDWVSSLSVSNISGEPADVTALFFEENRNNIPLFGPSHEFTVSAGATVTVDDVLGEWFPDQGDTKGFLVLLGEAPGAEEDPFLLTATGRIFNNADPSATYGQTVPPGELGLMVAPGASNLPGARSDDAVRSNVGVVNLSLFPLDIIISVFDADGHEVLSAERRVRAFSLMQWSLSNLGVGSLTVPGRVRIHVDPETVTWDPCFSEEPDIDDLQGIFMTYLSRVDQTTGDAEFVLGQSDWYDYLALCGDELPVAASRVFSVLRTPQITWMGPRD